MPEHKTVHVSDVARKTLHKIDGLATVRDAIDLMQQHNVSSLVIDRRHEGDEYAFVTVQDIAEKVVSPNRSLKRTSVYEIMSKPALTISPKMNVKYAIRLLARLGLTRALVADETAAPSMVTLRDLVLSYVEEDAAPPREGAV